MNVFSDFFKYEWLKEYLGLVYSAQEDGVYCMYYSFYVDPTFKGKLHLSVTGKKLGSSWATIFTTSEKMQPKERKVMKLI